MTILGLQTFTIRKELNNPLEMENALSYVSNLGIKHLELAYIPFETDYINHLEELLAKYNQKAISSQIPLPKIIKNYDQLLTIHRQLGMKYMAVSVVPVKNLIMGPIGMKKLARKLNELGKKCKKDGLTLLFHHHNYEFFKVCGNTLFDTLIKHLDSEYVKILSDTYWIRKGGYSIIEFLEKYKTHIKAVHLRGHRDGENTNLKDADTCMKEVIEYIKINNFFYGVIEQDTKEPLQEIKKSVEYISQHFDI